MKISRMSHADFCHCRNVCGFSDEETGVLDALRHERSIVQISMDMGMSTATVSRRIRSIKDKIGTELP